MVTEALLESSLNRALGVIHFDSQSSEAAAKTVGMTELAQGSFDVAATRQPPYDSADGLVLGRTSLVKTFKGDLEASSTVEMLSAGTPTKGSAVYVALERVSGKLSGRRGNFVLVHYGIMNRGDASLRLEVAPDSGTGELVGLTGQMQIEIKDGQHFYRFEYQLSA
jgi:hypothetical protein